MVIFDADAIKFVESMNAIAFHLSIRDPEEDAEETMKIIKGILASAGAYFDEENERKIINAYVNYDKKN